MHLIAWLALQTSLWTEAVPGQEEEADAPPSKAVGLGGDVHVLWTHFDDDSRIEDGIGVGADVRFSLHPERSTQFVMQAGVTSWETETVSRRAKEADVHVTRYRVGVGTSVRGEVLRLDLWANIGSYRYSGGNREDVGGFFNVDVAFGFHAGSPLTVGLLGDVTLTDSDFFDRSSSHLHDNTGYGIFADVRF